MYQNEQPRKIPPRQPAQRRSDARPVSTRPGIARTAPPPAIHPRRAQRADQESSAMKYLIRAARFIRFAFLHRSLSSALWLDAFENHKPR
jgi:hypothetical protein